MQITRVIWLRLENSLDGFMLCNCMNGLVKHVKRCFDDSVIHVIVASSKAIEHVKLVNMRNVCAADVYQQNQLNNSEASLKLCSKPVRIPRNMQMMNQIAQRIGSLDGTPWNSSGRCRSDSVTPHVVIIVQFQLTDEESFSNIYSLWSTHLESFLY